MDDKIKNIDFLIKDEEDAIKGYEERLGSFDENEKKVIEEIIADEKDHIAKLNAMKGGKPIPEDKGQGERQGQKDDDDDGFWNK